MAKHSSRRSPEGKRIRRLRTGLSPRTRRSVGREVARGPANVLTEVEHSTGLHARKLVDLRHGARGGSVAVVEVDGSTSAAGPAPDRYVVGLNTDGRVVSCVLTERRAEQAPTDVVSPVLPMELGLRADLDTDVAISVRRFNVLNLRLRGSIKPSKHKRLGRRRRG
ncbi:hypothetical protein GWK18_11190 [Kocuria sp. JC486]|uniref:hypothetical protein n=1 Tax=Kocuria sp. JC486 TaxID=1970736 RepID=UPI00141E4B06|nr:hypothetical protein [Kocuria sp. JC486]NHU86138.1 hypothetical protein [Kocuria sp. JC486]